MMNSLFQQLKGYFMVISRCFGENCPKSELSTLVVHQMLIEHKAEDLKWIFEEKMNHYPSFSDFSKTETINLK